MISRQRARAGQPCAGLPAVNREPRFSVIPAQAGTPARPGDPAHAQYLPDALRTSARAKGLRGSEAPHSVLQHSSGSSPPRAGFLAWRRISPSQGTQDLHLGGGVEPRRRRLRDRRLGCCSPPSH